MKKYKVKLQPIEVEANSPTLAIDRATLIIKSTYGMAVACKEAVEVKENYEIT